MADSDDGFVSRWSKRKRAARAPAPAEPPTPTGRSEAPLEVSSEAREADIAAELPDVDSLDEGSDFSVFLREGVPDAIRQKALRKLWRLNPLFANLDGLNDYDEDFTDAATVVEGLKTLYRAGKGLVDPGEGKDADQGAGAAAQEEAPRAESPPSADPESPPPESPPPEPVTARAARDEPDSVRHPTGKAKRTPARSARSRRWGDTTT